MAYKREVGGGGRILPNSRAIVLHPGGQCRWARGKKGWLIHAEKPRSERLSCKGQLPVGQGGMQVWSTEGFWGYVDLPAPL